MKSFKKNLCSGVYLVRFQYELILITYYVNYPAVVVFWIEEMILFKSAFSIQ